MTWLYDKFKEVRREVTRGIQAHPISSVFGAISFPELIHGGLALSSSSHLARMANGDLPSGPEMLNNMAYDSYVQGVLEIVAAVVVIVGVAAKVLYDIYNHHSGYDPIELSSQQSLPARFHQVLEQVKQSIQAHPLPSVLGALSLPVLIHGAVALSKSQHFIQMANGDLPSGPEMLNNMAHDSYIQGVLETVGAVVVIAAIAAKVGYDVHNNRNGYHSLLEQPSDTSEHLQPA